MAAALGYSLGRGKAQSLLFAHIRLLREALTPEMLSRLQARSPDLLLRRLVASSDPSDSESSLRTAVLNYKLVPNLNLASVTTQPHTMVGDVESMREMALLTPSDPETHWAQPISFSSSAVFLYEAPCSLRVALVGRVVIIVVFFFAVVFVFVLFLVWHLPQEDIDR
jgi:hypothetical protein